VEGKTMTHKEAQAEYDKLILEHSRKTATSEMCSLLVDGEYYRVLFANGWAYADDAALSKVPILPFSKRSEACESITQKIRDNAS